MHPTFFPLYHNNVAALSTVWLGGTLQLLVDSRYILLSLCTHIFAGGHSRLFFQRHDCRWTVLCQYNTSTLTTLTHGLYDVWGNLMRTNQQGIYSIGQCLRIYHYKSIGKDKYIHRQKKVCCIYFGPSLQDEKIYTNGKNRPAKLDLVILATLAYR